MKKIYWKLGYNNIMYEYNVKKVYKVVDGDTIDVDIDLGFNVSYFQRVRLAGIDTPESRTKDLYEKELGLQSKEWLKKKLEGAENIIIKTQKPDSTEKYGRILGDLHIKGFEKSLNQMMIDEGYAWGYMGDTKVKDFPALLAKRNSKA
jgi:micrococcal nuclease